MCLSIPGLNELSQTIITIITDNLDSHQLARRQCPHSWSAMYRSLQLAGGSMPDRDDVAPPSGNYRRPFRRDGGLLLGHPFGVEGLSI